MSQDSNNYWEQLERLEKLIRASELKAGVIFSFHSLILGLFVDRIERFKDVFMENPVLLALMLLWLAFVAISIFFCFKCFKPFMELSYAKNVFFFGDAASRFGNSENYTKALIEVCGSEKELYQLLAEQIHVESRIIAGKFKNVKRSITFFAISFVFVILTTVYWLLFT
jgi:hypothetical protein